MLPQSSVNKSFLEARRSRKFLIPSALQRTWIWLNLNQTQRPIILREILSFALQKSLIDLYEEKLTLRVGSNEFVFYAEKSKKSKNKQFAHAISVIDFSKDDPFSGSTTNHSDALPHSSSPVKTSDNLEEFADELTLFKNMFIFKFIETLFSNLMTTSPLATTIREQEEYLNHMTLLCEISTSRSQENVHADQSSIIESLPVSPIPVEDSEPVQEEIDIFLVLDDLIPPGVENDDFEDEDNELPNLDHQDDPSIPRPPPKPPDVEKCLEPEAGLNQQIFEALSFPICSRFHSKLPIAYVEF
ncbi:hypothetical protein Tco_0151015 [Tanacetum coccineum]